MTEGTDWGIIWASKKIKRGDYNPKGTKNSTFGD